jgi:hypothetical protein
MHSVKLRTNPERLLITLFILWTMTALQKAAFDPEILQKAASDM